MWVKRKQIIVIVCQSRIENRESNVSWSFIRIVCDLASRGIPIAKHECSPRFAHEARDEKNDDDDVVKNPIKKKCDSEESKFQKMVAIRR